MPSVRKTKKSVKKSPLGTLLLDHARFWMHHSIDIRNNYRGISRILMDFDLSELSKVSGIKKKELRKFLVITS